MGRQFPGCVAGLASLFAQQPGGEALTFGDSLDFYCDCIDGVFQPGIVHNIFGRVAGPTGLNPFWLLR
ncbi:MAG TPA: hypothetical protein VIG78_02985 [Gemmatimonadaceae bacterium]